MVVNDKVTAHLIEIFEAVADACDGGEVVTEDIQAVYNNALTSPDVRAFYDELINARHAEVFGNDQE